MAQNSKIPILYLLFLLFSGGACAQKMNSVETGFGMKTYMGKKGSATDWHTFQASFRYTRTIKRDLLRLTIAFQHPTVVFRDTRSDILGKRFLVLGSPRIASTSVGKVIQRNEYYYWDLGVE